MRKYPIVFLWIVFFIALSVKGNSAGISANALHDSVVFQSIKKLAKNPVYFPADTSKAGDKEIVYHKKHRLVAALLAFPLGVFGLHRIYMHTSPLVPLVYIATFGGLFGVLPFIDFVLILLNKDIHLTYTSNPHIFMWQKR